MNFQEACEAMKQLFSNVKTGDVDKFMVWTKAFVNQYHAEIDSQDNTKTVLNSIRDDIRETLPLEAVSETEHVMQPKYGKNADCDPRTTVHVDAFLYDDDAIDELVDEGKMSRNYCVTCLSKSVRPLTFITHSASVTQIKFIFQYLLQDLRGKLLVDVGSRTGALLYGAYLYSEASHTVGVEIDQTFCQLQKGILEKYSMTDRVKVICSDILEQGELLMSSDVVILNNVFEFFVPVEQQIKLWLFLSETVRKKGCLLITIPSIEESLDTLKVPINLESWVKHIDTEEIKDTAAQRYFTDVEDSDLDNIHIYQVV